jgi:hypothetical protein
MSTLTYRTEPRPPTPEVVASGVSAIKRWSDPASLATNGICFRHLPPGRQRSGNSQLSWVLADRMQPAMRTVTIELQSAIAFSRAPSIVRPAPEPQQSRAPVANVLASLR